MEYLPAFNMNQSLYGALQDSAKKYPKNRALIYMRRSFSYREVLNRTDALASNLLRMGFKRNDIITVCLPNIPDAIYWFYAISKIGAVAHLVHPLTPPEQMGEIFTRVSSRLLVVLHTSGQRFSALAQEKNIQVVLCNPSDFLPLPMRLIYNLKNPSPKPNSTLLAAKPLYFFSFNNIVQADNNLATTVCSDFFNNIVQADNNLATLGNQSAFDPVLNTAVLLHSGGTSGAPKTIALTDYAINSLSAKGAFALGSAEVQSKVMLSVLPMFHGFGMCMGIHAMLCHGGCNAIMPRFSAKETVRLLAKNRLNFLIGVPILYEALLKQKKFQGKKLQNIDIAFVGGDFVPHVLLKRADERFAQGGSKARLFEGYGLTETVTVCAVNTHADNRENSVGKPLPGLKIEAADENGQFLPRGTSGELYVTGDTLMKEYASNPTATAETFFVPGESLKTKQDEKWVKTGDFGYVDADGFVFFRQRLKRIIKVSGVSVYPFEIEQLVSTFNGVTAVCALDVPDAKHGSMIKLFVACPSLKQADRELLRNNIADTILKKLSVYAVPKDIIFKDALPTTSVGKIDAEILRKA